MARKRKTTEDFITLAIVVHGNKYNYSKTVYVKSNEKVCIICPEHGEFWLTPNSHLHGTECPKCGHIKGHKNITFSTLDFINRSKLIHGDKYDYSKVKYTNKRQKVLIICPIHGEFWLEAGHHMYGCGCPKCNSSKGELIIEQYLKSINILFKTLHPVNIDSSINPTGFAYIDFYLPDYNCFIEYNGLLHYIPQEHFGGELYFNKQQLRDNFIREYCNNNNITLIELKYDLSKEEIINTIENYLINNGYKIVET